ncbi:MAG: GreA/GreB family elongation factor [Patescibacteria group bacterium]|nr:GreA/GreB family elongation factor [Patescibacteria group bacterium]
MKQPPLKLTRAGLQKLKLKKVSLGEKLKKIVRQLGENSISENSTEDISHSQLVREKMFTQEELLKTTQLIDNANVIKKNHQNCSIVVPGCRVKLQNHKLCYTFQVVDPIEANSSEGKISIESPLGSAVINQKLGNKVCVITPAGKVDLEITKIM